MSAKDIIRVFKIDESETKDGMTAKDVYEKKLKESKKIGKDETLVGRNYSYKQYSLYKSIKTYWIKDPIEIDISNRLINDGLHRIACAYDIDKNRLIPIVYV